MKLFYTPNSCYARKVRVLSRETGLDAVIEEVAVTLRDPASELLKYSPVGRVPALLADDGRVYTETAIVCELLDAMHPGPRLIPLEDVARREALRLEGQAAGFMEGIAWWVRELRRAPEERSARLLEVERQRAHRCLDVFEAMARTEVFEGPLRIAQITTACTLGLADTFLRDEDWRRDRPALDAWYATMAQRASMRATTPVVVAPLPHHPLLLRPGPPRG